jgi:hypothetical protein
VGVPLGREHNPRTSDSEALIGVRLGDRIFDLDAEAAMVWSQGLFFPRRQDLAGHAKRQGIEGDPIEKLIAAGLMRASDINCSDLALIPLGIAVGNSPQTLNVFDIGIGRDRPMGVDPLTFAVWSSSYWGRSLKTVCVEVVQKMDVNAQDLAMHVLNQSEELLGTVFWLDLAQGGRR